MKQATMPDTPNAETHVFHGIRPSIVVDEASTRDVFSRETLLESAIPKTAGLDVKMSNEFQEQFITKYTARVFPWALNYDCGVADYPDLFVDWQYLEKDLGEEVASQLRSRWRRLESSAPLLPGPYAKMLACRPELQVAGDWMLVPATRNLHWRYTVLQSAFVLCKQKVNPGETMAENLDNLVKALENIWTKIEKNTAVIQKRKTPINGNMGLLFSDDDIGVTEKLLLRSYLDVTKNIAGCQALRSRMGHILFGMRCVYGEVIFFTVSPNRRHSALLLKLSRARVNDAMLRERDRHSADPSKVLAYWRHRYASPAKPAAFSDSHVESDPTGNNASRVIELPEVLVRQAWVSQDPLASVHHYQAIMYIAIPATLGSACACIVLIATLM